MSMKKMACGLLGCAMAFSAVTGSTTLLAADVSADKAVDVRVNGFLVDFPDKQPYVNSDSRTLIPVRFVAEALGADVSWDSAHSGALIVTDDCTILLPVGTNRMEVTRDGKTTTKLLDTTTIVEDGRTMIPIRAVAEEMGCWVSYSSAYDTVEIYNDALTAEEMNQLYAMEMPGWWTRDGISDYASPIMNIGSSTYENLSELAIRTMMDDWKRNGTLPGEYEGVSGEILDYTTATNEDVSYYLTEEIVSHFANRFGSAEDDVSAECRTNTACLFYAPYYDANRPSYFNFCYLTITFGPDYDAKHYAKYHYMDSFDLSACKPGESYTFLLCSLWGLYANGQWRTFNVENITTGPNADEWW